MLAARAYPRVGLLGNPSDQYEGKAIAFTFDEFSAEVRIEPGECFRIRPGAEDGLEFESLRSATQQFGALGCDDGIRLIRAALRRFAEEVEELAALPVDDPRLRFEISYATDIPRQSGLAGSSAIVVATLRALARWFDRPIQADRLADLALDAELRDLGIAAGPMDRAVQAHEGLLYMDFREPRGPASYRRLESGRLPPLLVAWSGRSGVPSGRLHGDVRSRWLAGDRDVRKAVARLPPLAERGAAALAAGDRRALCRLIDENFAARASVWPIGADDRRAIAIARGQGCAAKLCGSGGAVLAVPTEGDGAAASAALRAEGFRVFRPRVFGPRA